MGLLLPRAPATLVSRIVVSTVCREPIVCKRVNAHTASVRAALGLRESHGEETDGHTVNRPALGERQSPLRRLVRPPLRLPGSGAGAQPPRDAGDHAGTVPGRGQRSARGLLDRHGLRRRPPRRPGLADVQLGPRRLRPRQTVVARRHPGARRSPVAPQLQAADQPVLHRGDGRALRATHARPRDPAHRRLHRARLLRLHGRLRHAVPRPGVLRPGAERTGRPAPRAQRESGGGVHPHQPGRARTPRPGCSGGSASSSRRGGRSHPAAMSSTRSLRPTSKAGPSPTRRSSG